MAFQLETTIKILKNTPPTLRVLLAGLPEEWTQHTPRPGSWSPHEVVAHLVHGERTDWLPRTQLILEGKPGATFTPFDRAGHVTECAGKTLPDLVAVFRELRAKNVAHLEGLNLSAALLARTGIHPELGPVTLAQLLATWTVHDLTHLAQIARGLATKYRKAVGPWLDVHYLRALVTDSETGPRE